MQIDFNRSPLLDESSVRLYSELLRTRYSSRASSPQSAHQKDRRACSPLQIRVSNMSKLNRSTVVKPTMVMKALDSFKLDPRNPRKHNRRQLEKLRNSIKQFGFKVPILMKSDGTVIVGHARIEAAQLAGLAQIPAILCDDLTDTQIRAFRIADNRIAEYGEWDIKLLGEELQQLIDLDFAVEATGFETPQIDMILGDHQPPNEPDPADIQLKPESGVVVSRRGDLWQLGGSHLLLCADATDAHSFQRLLGNQKADMVFTDPPYNVPIEGHVSGLGKAHHEEFAMASGEMSDEEFIQFLQRTVKATAEAAADGALLFICMDWRHTEHLQRACRGFELKNICVWTKSNGGMGSLYRSQHEFVFVYKHGNARHINNVNLGRAGRWRSNVWDYVGANSFGAERDEMLKMHPTVKPVAMIADAILDVSKRNGIVLDPFAGSGSTILAAERTGRRAAAIEIDPKYVDVAIRRYQLHVGKPATLLETGQSFDELSAVRLNVQEMA